MEDLEKEYRRFAKKLFLKGDIDCADYFIDLAEKINEEKRIRNRAKH